MKPEWYSITDLKAFVEGSRVLVYSLFGADQITELSDINISIDALTNDEKTEINDCLSYKEALAISKEFVKIKKNTIIITEKLYSRYLESLTARLTSNLLSNMVKKGTLESAFDSETNDFIFWTKDDNE